MLKGISYVVETHSEQERVDLREFIFDKKLSASVTSEDDYQLIAIYTGDVWFLCTVTEDAIKSYQFKRFNSVKEFIEFYKRRGCNYANNP